MTEYKLVNFKIKEKWPGINCITHCKTNNYVAIGRENGLVELYDATQNYIFLAKFVASNLNAVDALEFFKMNNQVKLFGLAASRLFAVDVATWCISDEVQLSNGVIGRSLCPCGLDNNLVAVGCDSGSICLYDYQFGLQLVREIRDIGSAIMCLAWSPWHSSVLMAGSVNRLYKIDLETHEVIHHQLTAAAETTVIQSNLSSSKNIIVWCATICEYGDNGESTAVLCTGDSGGYVTVWDIVHLAILGRYKTHSSDILALCYDGNSSSSNLYASGAEPTIITVDLRSRIISDKRYGMSGTVRGLSLNSNNESIMAVGDCGSISIYSVAMATASTTVINDRFMRVDFCHQYECRYHKESRSTIVFIYNNKSIDVYQINHRIINVNNNNNNGNQSSSMRRHLLSFCAEHRDNIVTFTVSDDLKYLAYSTDRETRILIIDILLNDDNDNVTMKIKRFYKKSALNKENNDNGESRDKKMRRNVVSIVERESASLSAASLLKFVQCADKLYLIVITQQSIIKNNNKKQDDEDDEDEKNVDDNNSDNDEYNNYIYLICGDSENEANSLFLKTKFATLKEENHKSKVQQIAVSHNGSVVALATLDGLVFIYSLDTFSILTKIAAAATVTNADMLNSCTSVPLVTTMSFNSTDKRLVMILGNKKIVDFHIAKKMKSVWCRTFNSRVYHEWIRVGNARQITPLAANKFIMLLGKNIMTKLDMDKKVPEPLTPLFVKKLRTNELKLQNIKREWCNRRDKLSKLKQLASQLEKQQENREKDLEVTKKRIAKAEAKLAAVKALNVEEHDECCFSWYNSKYNIIGMHYMPTEQVLLTFSPEMVEVEDMSYSKKLFGL